MQREFSCLILFEADEGELAQAAAQQGSGDGTAQKGAATGSRWAEMASIRAVCNTNICGSVICPNSQCLSTRSTRAFVKAQLCRVPRGLVLLRELP